MFSYETGKYTDKSSCCKLVVGKKKSQEPPPPSQSHENNHHQNQFYEQAITITQTTHRHKQEKSDLVSIISENQSFLFLSLF